MAAILVIEDDAATNEAICEYMTSLGHSVLSARDGEQGALLAAREDVDIVILDIMLPRISGLDVLKALRAHSDAPVIMLTALDDEYTQAASFDQSADDYMTKPFSLLILGKRVEALLRRRGKSAEPRLLKLGDVTIDFGGYTAHRAGQPIDITPREIDLLKLLFMHKGMVLTRAQILDQLWGYDRPIMDRTIDTYIKNLRKKLGADNIVTVKGIGYKYEERS